MFSLDVALAIPPPDFLFNVGSQIVQIFSVIAVVLSAVLVSIRQFAKTYFFNIKHKKLLWTILALIVIGVSFWGATWYEGKQQTAAYLQWVAESQQNVPDPELNDSEIDKLKADDPNEVELVAAEVIEHYDAKKQFIYQYYQNIGSANLSDAYDVSKKSVSFAVFESWYKDVESVEVDNFQKIDDDKFSFRVKIMEGGVATQYAILMDLEKDAAGNLKVKDSQSKVLVVPDSREGVEEGDLPLAVTNADFQKAINAGAVYVLDAREDEEYEIGYFPGSHHIRFADLLAGEWISLPDDEVVYVFCWSGIRGKEVAEFLREKGIKSRYVKNGADDWVSSGGTWSGGIKFSEVHPEARYQKTFTTAQIKSQMANGTVIVDSRNQGKFNSSHLPGAYNIPIIYTPTSQMAGVLAQVPAGSDVITVCDDFVSCFDAKLSGLKLEKLGHTFLGRYNRPWEYK